MCFWLRLRRLVLLVGGLSILGCGASGEAPDFAPLVEHAETLKTGTATAVKPGIGSVSLGCTASLITSRHVLMAAHCNFHRDTLKGTETFTAGGATRNVSRIFIVGAEENPGQAVPPGNLDLNPDVAILELSSAIPADIAAPLLVAAGPPSAGTQVTIYGASSDGANCEGPAAKRFFTFSFGEFTAQFCHGDSGGPATYGSASANGAIWGVASFISGKGDVWGNVSRYKEDILSVIRMWDHGTSTGIAGAEAGIRRNGVVFQTLDATSATSCQALCNDTCVCNSFRHDTATNTCFLQRDAGDWVPDSNFTSGLSATNRFETNVDRVGFDYANYVTSRSQCSLDCSNESRCAAFSWVSGLSRCFLKEYLGRPVAATGVDSGTKRGFEYFTDRPGNDIVSFDVEPADVRTCQAACGRHATCAAYTYRQQPFRTAHPWGPTAKAHCSLKTTSSAPLTSVTEPPSMSKRLISGVRRSTP